MTDGIMITLYITPMLDEVIAEMSKSMHQNYGNPSSIHREGRTARASVEQARKTVAKALGASIGMALVLMADCVF